METKHNLTPDSPGPKLARNLVPIDFSRNSAEALRYAVPLARQVGGKITLLHGPDWPVIPATADAAMTDEAAITGTAKKALDQLALTSVPVDVSESATGALRSALPFARL